MANGDEEEGPPEPVLRTNLLRVRRQAAVTRAETAVETIGGDSGNPLSVPLEAIENGAWDSPSVLRTSFIEDLDGTGRAVKSAFDGALGDLETALAEEPDEQIDIAAHPELEWKTSYSSIDLRSGYGYGYY